MEKSVDLIDTAAQLAAQKLNARPSRKTDELLGILHALADFEERIEDARVDGIVLFEENKPPLSAQYNDSIQRIMDDMRTIRAHQESTISALLSSWNEAEEIVSSAVD